MNFVYMLLGAVIVMPYVFMEYDRRRTNSFLRRMDAAENSYRGLLFQEQLNISEMTKVIAVMAEKANTVVIDDGEEEEVTDESDDEEEAVPVVAHKISDYPKIFADRPSAHVALELNDKLTGIRNVLNSHEELNIPAEDILQQIKAYANN